MNKSTLFGGEVSGVVRVSVQYVLVYGLLLWACVGILGANDLQMSKKKVGN